MAFYEPLFGDSKCWACGHGQKEHSGSYLGFDGRMFRCSHETGINRCLCMNFRWTRPVY